MPIVLSRMFRPSSTAIEAVGYTPNYGVVVKYKNGSEYHCPSWGYTDYYDLLRGPSCGHAVAQKRSRTHQEGRSFYKVEGTHFPTVDTWDYRRESVYEAERRKHIEQIRQRAKDFYGSTIWGPVMGRAEHGK